MTSLSPCKFKITKRGNLISPKIDSRSISIIIPVHDNQSGIDRFLDAYFDVFSPSDYVKEIIVVDNNSNPPIIIQESSKQRNLPIRLIFSKKLGPASARNSGWSIAKGDWLLFTDSDCIPTENFLKGYLIASNGSIGYAGRVRAFGKDNLSNFYETQQILIPPMVNQLGEAWTPQYLITSNCLVWKKAMEEIKGFDENYQIAGGEDVDLGLRLLEFGRLSYAPDSIVLHDFSDGFKGFVNRFVRYGTSLKLLNRFRRIDCRPALFKNKGAGLYNVVMNTIMNLCFLWGYYSARGLTAK